MTVINCRICNAALSLTFCDLGISPLSNSFLLLNAPLLVEQKFPLHVRVCSKCFLVQLPQVETPGNIFSDYVYFSSFSSAWLQHSKTYAERMISELSMNASSQVVELASNDGYLLQYFKAAGIKVLGIEPAKNVALVAQEKLHIPTWVKFFGTKTARELVAENIKADLLIGNNVLAHVPDIRDFVQGMQLILKPDGVITMEFPHVLQLIENNQFDTIYHEHFSYLSFFVVEQLFAQFNLQIYKVEELPTHGGSLRIFAKQSSNTSIALDESIKKMKEKEILAGLHELSTYTSFNEKTKKVKEDLLNFLLQAKAKGKRLVGYGAPAKGNTLLNYCGVTPDLMPFTVDVSPYKQGKLLPGVHIPVFHPDKIRETKPDYLLILPWNIKDEIIAQMSYIGEWGGKFVLPIPHLELVPGKK